MTNGPAPNQPSGSNSGHQSGGGPSHLGSGQGGLSHSGSLAVAIVHDIPLHPHIMPPLTHHGGHLSNHHQVKIRFLF